MNDMSQVIVPKSDQWNADDFLSGAQTFTITGVQIRGGQEQPVSISVEGSDKVFRPCKSMSRVLVTCWGPDASKYIGRSLTLYTDTTVLWGGMKVGGIRISHMSDIAEAHTMALTATKGSRKPFTVKPMAKVETKPAPKGAVEADPDLRASAEAEAAKGVAAYLAFWKSITVAQRHSLAAHHEALKATAKDADARNDPFGLPPLEQDAAAPADGADPVVDASAKAPQERQQRTAEQDAFFDSPDLEIPAPKHTEKNPDWHGWGKRLVALIEVAQAAEIEVLRSHNAGSRERCFAAADPKIVSQVDAAFAAAEKRTGG